LAGAEKKNGDEPSAHGNSRPPVIEPAGEPADENMLTCAAPGRRVQPGFERAKVRGVDRVTGRAGQGVVERAVPDVERDVPIGMPRA
jgi:hypothetical protein